jgi:8-hydroxy-5-deazaflavin:NADPH oxidoreductase
MKIAVLGTGMVGKAQAEKLVQLGHNLMIGTHHPDGKVIKGAKVTSYTQATKHGQLIIEAIKGDVVVDTLKSLATDLEGKTLVDISNALDFSSGEVKITTANGPSLGEQIQAALPKTNVVKAFNTMNATIQVDPESVAGGDHHLFIAGNDKKAKDQVADLAKSYGWTNIIDLGDIKAARGMEMLMPFWLSVRAKLGSSNFNYKIAT